MFKKNNYICCIARCSALILCLIAKTPVLAQATHNDASMTIDKMLDAQMQFDYVKLDKLEAAVVQGQRTSGRGLILNRVVVGDGAELAMLAKQATTEEEKARRLRQYVVAVRQSVGICSGLLNAELSLGAFDALKNDCYTAYSLTNHQDDTDCVIWQWLGLCYAVEQDAKRSVACFTIALRKYKKQNPSLGVIKDGGLSDHPDISCHILYKKFGETLYPEAMRNFQAAQHEVEAESNDRFSIKYGD